MFYIGQKVTPKNDSPWFTLWTHRPIAGAPEFGKVYTIWNKLDYFGYLFLSLDEIQEGRIFAAAEFRPVCERPTSIEIFDKIRRREEADPIVTLLDIVRRACL